MIGDPYWIHLGQLAIGAMLGCILLIHYMNHKRLRKITLYILETRQFVQVLKDAWKGKSHGG